MLNISKTKTLGSMLAALILSASWGCSSSSTSGGNTALDSGGGTGGGGGGKTFDGGTDPNRNKVTAGGICQRLAEIQCAGEAFCCTNPGRDVTACIAAQKKGCSDTLQFDAIAQSPLTGFDPTKAEAAFTQFESLASKCDPAIAEFGIKSDGLRGIVAGTVAPGGACDEDGTTIVALATALASCKDPAAQACLPAATGGWKCAPLAASGGHCYTDVNCQAGLFCDNPRLDVAGSTCAARKAADAACTLPNECESFACKNPTGDTGAGKCLAKSVDTAYCLAQ